MAKSFSIQEFAEKVSVSTSALRAWERRYQLFSPDRTTAGYRNYGAEDLLLYWFVEIQRESGQSLSVIAKQGRDEILSQAWAFLRGVQEPALKLLNLLKKGEFTASFRFLDILAAFCETPVIFADYCLKYMAVVGESWHSGELSIASEHAFTSQVRHFMTAFLYQDSSKINLDKTDSKNGKVICTALEGEFHELGILRVAIYLKEWGLDVVYLGANTPLETLITYSNDTSPSVVCISATRTLDVKNLVRTLMTNHPKTGQNSEKKSNPFGCPCVIGGASVGELSADQKDLQSRDIYLLQSMEDLRRIVLNLGP